MAVTQYIGARYVPLFADPAEWSSDRTYEPLTIVLHQGNSYTSRQFVPRGIQITDARFWAETGNYNAQVEQYRQEVLTFGGRIDTVEASVTAETTRATAAEQANADAITAETTRATTAEQANADAITAETTRATAAEQANAAAITAEATRATAAEQANADAITALIAKTNGKLTCYATVSDMVADNGLRKGFFALTYGFGAAGDGGSAIYAVTDTATANGMDVIALANGLFAQFVPQAKQVTLQAFGADSTGAADASGHLAVALSYGDVAAKGTFKVEAEVNVPEGRTISGGAFVFGDDAQFVLDSHVTIEGSTFDFPAKTTSTIQDSRIKADHKDDIVIRNCKFDAKSDINIGFIGSKNSMVSNCTFENSPGCCVRFDNTSNCRMADCVIVNAPDNAKTGLHCVDVNSQLGDTTNFVIENCDISNFFGAGLQFTGDQAEAYTYKDCIVSGCYIHDPTQRPDSSASNAIKYDAQYGSVKIVDCEFGGQYLNYGLYVGGTSGSCKKIDVRNCTFKDIVDGPIRAAGNMDLAIVEGCEFVNCKCAFRMPTTIDIFIFRDNYVEATTTPSNSSVFNMYVSDVNTDYAVDTLIVENNRITAGNAQISVAKTRKTVLRDNVFNINAATDVYSLNRFGYFASDNLVITGNTISVPNNAEWSKTAAFRSNKTSGCVVMGANTCEGVLTSIYDTSTFTTLITYGS